MSSSETHTPESSKGCALLDTARLCVGVGMRLTWGARAQNEAAAAQAEAREVLPVVASPQGDAFPGLYTVGLLPQPIVGQPSVATSAHESFKMPVHPR